MNLLKKIRYKLEFILKICVIKILYGNKVEAGKGLAFRKGFEINLATNQAKVIIGKNVFFNNYCSINCHKKIQIGDNCIFGESVKIYDHNHRFRDINRPIMSQGYSIKNVTIGTNCWIGSNVCILPGSHIGDNVIVGAGTIISGIIPDGVIVTANRELTIVQRGYYDGEKRK